jgi:hypothetical protein
MDLSRGHIDDLMNAMFGPAYVTPVSAVSVTWQTAEFSGSSTLERHVLRHQ